MIKNLLHPLQLPRLKRMRSERGFSFGFLGVQRQNGEGKAEAKFFKKQHKEPSECLSH